ncbi:CoA-binding protein [Gorgonomyces haynaldii]|nr:CoA-binding protein [Gorgonomyces haynaldii]
MALAFFKNKTFAVVGASTDTSKFGYKVLEWYTQRGLQVVPINPKAPEILGIKTVKDVLSLEDPKGTSVSIVTPPKVTEQVVDQMIQVGITQCWMQPGSESDLAIQKARDAGINVVVGGGACVLRDGDEALSKL